jgi:hypothetical protein
MHRLREPAASNRSTATAVVEVTAAPSEKLSGKPDFGLAKLSLIMY